MAVPNSCSTVSGFQGPRPPSGGLPRQAARLYITRVPRPPQDSVSRSIIPPYFIIKAIISKLELSALASTYTKDMKPSALKTIASFCRNEAVLCIAFVCALISSFFVPAGHDFASSVDLRVIVLLFCLMGATAGLQNAGVLSRSAHCLLSKVSGLRQLGFLLVALPFFASMIVTNDVALLAFVPFAILTLSITDKKRHLPRIVVLQAVAANIGGMVTPVGNPQNLFIYTAFQTPFLQFFLTLLPFALATFFALAVVCLTFPRESIHVSVSFGSEPIRRSKALIHSVLFLLCLAAAVRILPYSALLPVTLLALLLFDRGIYRKIDYGLLATFFCFFVFSGNMCVHPLCPGNAWVGHERGSLFRCPRGKPSHKQRSRRCSAFAIHFQLARSFAWRRPGRTRDAYRFSRKPDSNEALSSHPGSSIVYVPERVCRGERGVSRPAMRPLPCIQGVLPDVNQALIPSRCAQGGSSEFSAREKEHPWRLRADTCKKRTSRDLIDYFPIFPLRASKAAPKARPNPMPIARLSKTMPKATPTQSPKARPFIDESSLPSEFFLDDSSSRTGWHAFSEAVEAETGAPSLGKQASFSVGTSFSGASLTGADSRWRRSSLEFVSCTTPSSPGALPVISVLSPKPNDSIRPCITQCAPLRKHSPIPVRKSKGPKRGACLQAAMPYT